jgi:hypothetical protein
MAVAKSEFTSFNPIFAKIDVRAAKIADKAAKGKYAKEVRLEMVLLLSIIQYVPKRIATTPIILKTVKDSFRKIIPIITVKHTLDLSTADTFITSPIDNALKYEIQDKPVHAPDKTKKTRLVALMVFISNASVRNTNAHRNIKINPVRKKTAVCGFICFKDNFENSAVSDEKTADNNANITNTGSPFRFYIQPLEKRAEYRRG